MDLTLARSLAQQLVAALADAPPSTSVIKTPADFDAAYAAASAGAILVLDPTFVYPGPRVFDRPVTLATSGTLPDGRIAADVPLPRFLSKVVFVNGGAASGVEFRNTSAPNDNIIEAYGSFAFDRIRVLGDPIAGAKRGIAAFPAGDASIRRSYIDDCFQAAPGSDSQAICMWSGHGLTVDDCFLRAGSETFLLGGADSSSADTMPSDVTLRNCTITKRPEWQAKAIGVKNAIEIKAGRRILIEHNDVSYSWAQGQVGYLLLLTVRNQDGTAPWSTIEDVTIQSNTFAKGASAISILGCDYLQPSGRLARVQILNNTFTELDPDKYQKLPDAQGTDKLILLQGGPIDLSICDNRFEMVRQPSSQIYFDWSGNDRTKATNLVVTGNTWPKALYGIFGTQGSANNWHNTVWQTFVESGTLGPNTESLTQ